MTVFWVVAPCSLIEVYQRFRGTCCLHHQGGESISTQGSSEVNPDTYRLKYHKQLAPRRDLDIVEREKRRFTDRVHSSHNAQLNGLKPVV
jgi:hypothetical protein